MRITAVLNGVSVKKNIPTDWGGLTFGKYLDLLRVDINDPNAVLSVLTGIDPDTMKRSKIVGLDVVLNRLEFLKTPMSDKVPDQIIGHRIPKDLAFESTGQYADLQGIIDSFPKDLKPGDPMPADEMAKYAEIVTIYAMPGYLDAKQTERDEFTKMVFNAPCQEVLAIGNFTLLKLIALRLNIRQTSPLKNTPMRKLRLAIRGYLANLVSSLRFWRWRKLLRSQGINLRDGRLHGSSIS